MEDYMSITKRLMEETLASDFSHRDNFETEPDSVIKDLQSMKNDIEDIYWIDIDTPDNRKFSEKLVKQLSKNKLTKVIVLTEGI